MELIVFWTELARDKLNDIFQYYRLESKNSRAKRVVDSIVAQTIGLENQAYIGQIEELLSDRPQQFRYLVYKNYKIVYWINTAKHRIDVSHVFDTRQDPLKIREID